MSESPPLGREPAGDGGAPLAGEPAVALCVFCLASSHDTADCPFLDRADRFDPYEVAEAGAFLRGESLGAEEVDAWTREAERAQRERIRRERVGEQRRRGLRPVSREYERAAQPQYLSVSGWGVLHSNGTPRVAGRVLPSDSGRGRLQNLARSWVGTVARRLGRLRPSMKGNR